MQQPAALYEPLRFLTLELQKQLYQVESFLESGDLARAEQSLSRVDYIDNHHLNLLRRISEHTRLADQTAEVDPVTLQSYDHINHSLKTLSRQLQEIVFQARNAPKTAFRLLTKKRVRATFKHLTNGLELIEPAIEAEASTLAIDICRLQVRIDQVCQAQLKKYQNRLRKGQQTDALLNASFIVRDLNRLGEALLRIGEGIISANLGQMIQIERYHSLEATLSALSLDPLEEALTIRAMGETKSGCTISGVMSAEESEGEMLAVFKAGDKTKLKEEKTGIESWHEIYPGIAPKVYSYHNSGNKAALLFEYLTGDTLEKLLLERERKALREALAALFETLENIWQETRIETVHPAHFMRQLKKRLKDVYQVHPELESQSVNINGLKNADLKTLIEQAEAFEATLSTPAAVYIHGDFNLDNILYDPLSKEINFIDLHRSDYQDYVQDLSVLMVSCYRLNRFGPQDRKLIAQTMHAIYDYGRNWAETIGDTDYELRLALGLSRSFLTSTRFVLDSSHAKAMQFRARFLLESLLKLPPEQLHTYRVPREIYHD
ncbi:aminoglycoside phosphotransferase family protein [Thiomicrospira sp. WB1]|uniref:aminoglycoside phosphotransferase family protein n=1 Tax=Thiomicrospira sp. WB1 TaxID=1685380 RepID=UPI000748FE7F|nr:aminoglycoside phosphotransferase family protein [Thiomicrospira sp. WB1]KUJ71743.1 hypothetical protein AVO41_04545 [Thiomicrospira sp. WB1]